MIAYAKRAAASLALCVAALNPAAALATTMVIAPDNWLVATSGGVAYFLDASWTETDPSGVRYVAEWAFFRGTPSMQQLDLLKIDCREKRARVVLRTRMDTTRHSSVTLSGRELGDGITRWRAAAEDRVRRSEIAFTCASDTERAANPNWRRLGSESMEEAARAAFRQSP
jgi:hypothetical protein